MDPGHGAIVPRNAKQKRGWASEGEKTKQLSLGNANSISDQGLSCCVRPEFSEPFASVPSWSTTHLNTGVKPTTRLCRCHIRDDDEIGWLATVLPSTSTRITPRNKPGPRLECGLAATHVKLAPSIFCTPNAPEPGGGLSEQLRHMLQWEIIDQRLWHVDTALWCHYLAFHRVVLEWALRVDTNPAPGSRPWILRAPLPKSLFPRLILDLA